NLLLHMQQKVVVLLAGPSSEVADPQRLFEKALNELTPAAGRFVVRIITDRRVTDDHESDSIRCRCVRLEPVPLPLGVTAGHAFAPAAIPGVTVPAFRLDFGEVVFLHAV